MNPKRTNKEKSTKGDRPSLREWMAVKLDVPAELLDGDISVRLCGRYSMVIHGCRRILSFTPSEVRLDMGSCELSVWGKRLICTAFLAGDVGVEGLISGMVFDREEGGWCESCIEP